MSLYRRKDSPYWWVKLPAIAGETRPLCLSTGTDTKRRAQEFHDRLKAERWEQDKLGKKPRYTWQDAVVKFLQETTHKRTHERDKSMFLWLHPALGGKCLDEIDRTVVDSIKFQRAEIATKATANRYLALIRTVLRKAHREWEWIERVPTVTLFRESAGRVRYLTLEEFNRLHRELPPHLADMALFSVATGMRQANVKGLRWADVDLLSQHVRVAGEAFKNGRSQGFPLNAAAMAVLQKRIGQHSEYVFSYRGKPITNVSTKAWWAGLERAGISDFRWHDLRHTFATWHRQAGTPTHELQMLGGWLTRAMVDRYAHIAPEGLQQASGRLDNVLQGYALATPERQKGRP
ncbi:MULTISPECIES: tyrosine-type recombinase/integrase [Ramlibacter]|uniref:Tyrosine-type recombinase/integrase n=1 Tax=Ramlibacter pinisoli TaxID=2682844 RepID=A0A6N8IUP2_9BURK|nr:MULTISPECIES: site-specific integrase [Ramlibacter]MBA2960742.1 site-specific integrase [Ramlibacter sp. CGMCC 1.13660]MVQ30689.1 tyrosine-type recombinase/integrase [Ramlibacter pinisoli]